MADNIQNIEREHQEACRQIAEQIAKAIPEASFLWEQQDELGITIGVVAPNGWGVTINLEVEES